MVSRGIRTHTCGELREEHVGEQVRLSGWVHAHRDKGALVFVDLRDRYGITQVAFDETVPDALREAAAALRSECVVSVAGTVRARPEGMVNAERPSGAVEVLASGLEVLGPSRTPPFPVDGPPASDELRMRYRYVDLRRPQVLSALAWRHRVVLAIRNALSTMDFLEVETPILTKATPEGARDYLVPSRVHPGRFFALPQSPQIFKQILMVSGVDRYFQICKCFRDEDLRADRQPEFTQLDLEMSFVEEPQVREVVDRAVAAAVAAVRPDDVPGLPIPRISWSEAIERWGSDKPDRRFGLELADVSEVVRGSGFAVFSGAVDGGGRVRMLAVPGGAAFSRKEITGLEEVARAHGAKGLAWCRVGESDEHADTERSAGRVLEGGIAKFLSAEEQEGLVAAGGAQAGDLLLFVADRPLRSAQALGQVRLAVGRRLGQIEEGGLDFLWVDAFPMFESDEEGGPLTPAHHPFCQPAEEYEGQLEQDPERVMAHSYDLVLNGVELGSGSIRIHESRLQDRVFRALGLSEEVIRDRFGWIIDAFEYGAPPHAGFAIGLDRLVMILVGADSIREVIAFPKTAQATCLLTGAPSPVDEEQLAEAGVAVLAPDAGRRDAVAGR